MRPIYLDNNATTAMHPEVAAVIDEAHLAGYANPASQHRSGQRARRVLETSRDEIARILGARCDGPEPDRVILTSGATESNNLALRGQMDLPNGNLVVSPIEHPSIDETARQMEREGTQVRRLAVTEQGVVDTAGLVDLLDERTRLVSVMLGNHETGVMQPVPEVVEICRERRIPVHTDAVQAIGKIAVDFRALGVASLSVSAHKFHGPVGIGALLLRHDVHLQPMLWGGFQQGGSRPGTESVALSLGFLKALQLWEAEAAIREQRLRALRNQFESSLRAHLPEIVIHGQDVQRLPHTSNVSFPDANRQALLMALDMAGLDCSTGSACASGSSQPSPVLQAMGLDDALVESSLRFSLGALTTAAEIDQAVHCISHVYNSLRHSARKQKASATSRTADSHPI